jgi:hypothetical protein
MIVTKAENGAPVKAWDAHVRVTLGNGTRMEYRIDRWD